MRTVFVTTGFAFIVWSSSMVQSQDHGSLFETLPEKTFIAESPSKSLATQSTAVSGGNPVMTFGRLFGDSLPSFIPSVSSLDQLGAALVEDATAAPSSIPAIYTYFGQFVDHDITFDITPLSENLENIGQRRNMRDPTLALDSVYGAGPDANPYLYERNSGRLLVGQTTGGQPRDLPRLSNRLAVIGDPRNDENLIVANLQLAFIKAHNRLHDSIAAGSGAVDSPFDSARRSLAWHYQWIVVNDFLRRVLDQNILDQIVLKGPKLYDVENPSMPIEFSVAAYRFGHSMVRADYDFNATFSTSTLGQLFTFTGGGGSAPIPDIWIIDWPRFVNDPPNATNFARKLDPYLSLPLTQLPNLDPANLAIRNLRRGRSLGLPSGQNVARALGADVLDPTEFAVGQEATVVQAAGFDTESPLWYYILKEAEVKGGGERLGPVGSTIVAETFIGLLLSDASSFLATNPSWEPILTLNDGTKVRSLPTLIRYANGE